MTRATLLAAATLALALGGGWREAAAHGTGARVLGPGAATVEFYYSTGEPMAYVDAKLFAPGETPAVLAGRTDKLGRFAFLPDRDGDWRVEAKDDEGHSAGATVTVAGGAAQPGASPSTRWALWASLTANIVLVLSLWPSLRQRPPDQATPAS